MNDYITGYIRVHFTNDFCIAAPQILMFSPHTGNVTNWGKTRRNLYEDGEYKLQNILVGSDDHASEFFVFGKTREYVPLETYMVKC